MSSSGSGLSLIDIEGSGYDLVSDVGLIAGEYMENLLKFLLERKFCYPALSDKSGDINSAYNLYNVENPIIVGDYASAIPELTGSQPSDFLKNNFLNQLTGFINTYRETRANNTKEIVDNMIINNLIQELINSHSQTKSLLVEKRDEISDEIAKETTETTRDIDAIKEVIRRIEMRRFHIATLQDYSLIVLIMPFLAIIISGFVYSGDSGNGFIFYVAFLVISFAISYSVYFTLIYKSRRRRIEEIIGQRQEAMVRALTA